MYPVVVEIVSVLFSNNAIYYKLILLLFNIIMIVGFGRANKSSTSIGDKLKITPNKDSYDIEGCENLRASAVTSSGLKPTPKATIKKNPISEETMREEKQFVMDIKNILKQSASKEIKETMAYTNTYKDTVEYNNKVVNTCSSQCKDNCKCRKSKQSSTQKM
jgi:hypothetical protein